MAASWVVGIEFGSQNCYVTAASARDVEAIVNGEGTSISLPSFVAFSGNTRIFGDAAKLQQIKNMENTIYNFKRLLGRKYTDPQVQREIKLLMYKTSEQPDGSVGIHGIIDLPVESFTKGLSQSDLDSAIETERKMVAEDRRQ